MTPRMRNQDLISIFIYSKKHRVHKFGKNGNSALQKRTRLRSKWQYFMISLTAKNTCGSDKSLLSAYLENSKA